MPPVVSFNSRDNTARMSASVVTDTPSMARASWSSRPSPRNVRTLDIEAVGSDATVVIGELAKLVLSGSVKWDRPG